MRPPRPDIAVPPIPPGIEWIGGEIESIDRLVAARPVLVHFFDLAQLNSVRTLPYLKAWHERYAPEGLSLIGIHSPRFPFTQETAVVSGAVAGLGFDWPVAVDREFLLWRLYEPHGWPALFLWGRGGALRWYHLGEGDYAGTEEAIREALADDEGNGADRDWGPPLDPMRPEDAAGAQVIAPTPELYPGGSTETPWSGGDAIEVAYEAAGAHAALDGAGRIELFLDEHPLQPVEVSGPGLYPLTEHERTERHELRLVPAGSVRVYSVQFAPGLAADAS